MSMVWTVLEADPKDGYAEADRDLGDIEGDVPDDEPPLVDNDPVPPTTPDPAAA